MMTRVSAQAMMASGALWLTMLSRLRGVRNESDSMVSPAISSAMMMRMP